VDARSKRSYRATVAERRNDESSVPDDAERGSASEVAEVRGGAEGAPDAGRTEAGAAKETGSEERA
jgi:hypothetical protein